METKVVIDVIGVVFLVGAAIALIVSETSYNGGFFYFCMAIIMGILGAIILLSDGTHSTPPKQRTQAVAQNTVSSTDNSASTTAQNESQASNNSTSDDKTKSGKTDPQIKDFKNTSSDEWQNIAQKSIQKARIVCDDGVQLKVIIWTSDDTSPDAIAVWPRVHSDGKPFSCSESKDPTKEVSP